MAAIIIEVVNVLGHVLERHKFDDFPIKFGRGYDNDLILSDPYVSPEHCHLVNTDAGWQISDLGSENGFIIKSKDYNSSNIVKSGEEIVIGKTRLRIYAPDHRVDATHILPASNGFSDIANKTIIALLAVTITLAVYLVNYYLVTSREIPFIKLLAAALPAILSAAFWAGIWAFIGRIIKHKANFKLQLTVTLAFVIALMFINTLKEYTLFISSNAMLTMALETLLTGAALSLLFLVNLQYGTNAVLKTRLWTSNAVAWGIIFISLFFNIAQKPEFSLSPSFPAVLKPPFANVMSQKPMDQFLTDSENIFEPGDSG